MSGLSEQDRALIEQFDGYTYSHDDGQRAVDFTEANLARLLAAAREQSPQTKVTREEIARVIADETGGFGEEDDLRLADAILSRLPLIPTDQAGEITDEWALEAVEKAGRGEACDPRETVAAYVYELGWRDCCKDSAAPAHEPQPQGWRPEVRAFADLMEVQLRANDHKPGWKTDRVGALISRLETEVGQLKDRLIAAEFYDSSDRGARQLPDPAAIARKRTAHVANFAMMIADVCGALDPAQNGRG